MLKLSILLILSIFSYKIHAQSASFLEPKNKWIERQDSSGYHGYGSFNIDTLTLGNDTIIESKAYKKMLNSRFYVRRNGNVQRPDTIRTKNIVYGYFREEKARLYFKKTPDKKEQLLYDFDSYKVGDTLQFLINDTLRSSIQIIQQQNLMYITIDSIDTIKLKDNIERRIIYYHFTSTTYGCTLGWRIEGIGSIGGILIPILSTFYGASAGNLLEEFKVDTLTVILDPCNKITPTSEITENNIKIYPNPATNMLKIDFGEKDYYIEKIRIINLVGQNQAEFTIKRYADSNIEIPTNTLKAGIYIINIELQNHKTINKKIIISN